MEEYTRAPSLRTRTMPASRSRARWCETSGWLWSSGPVMSQTQRSPPSRNSRICARTGLQNALKNGTKSVMLPTSERSSLAFMPPPRDALQRNGLARCTQHSTLTCLLYTSDAADEEDSVDLG